MDKLLIEVLSIRRHIEAAEVVSFDIFDTLLQRPYLQPTDLFLHMERAYRTPHFARRRVEAEQTARAKRPELQDITLSHIYDEMGSDDAPMLQRELEWEEMTLRADPEVQQAYHYARSLGKRIIITSDMYLPADFLARLLRKNGYESWERLYVSSEVGACKHNGSLYQLILADLGLSPALMLHIGDNKQADYKIPRKLGIAAVRYLPPARRFIKQHAPICAIFGASAAPRTLSLSILTAMLSYDWQLRRCGLRPYPSYGHTLGYRYAGPIAYGYTRYAERTAQAAGAEALLFVARDGYLLQKIHAGLHSSLPSAYIYAPRFLNHICRLDYKPGDTAQARSIISFFARQDAEIAALSTPSPTDPHAFIQQHLGLFRALACKQLQQYRAYLHSHIPAAAHYALVDTITGEFSSQQIIQSSLGAAVQGIYWGICDAEHAASYTYSAFAGVQGASALAEGERIFTKAWAFVEFLLSSPEHPILYVEPDGTPIHATQQSPYEQARADLYPHLAEGALQFARDVQDRFAGHDTFFDAPSLVRWIDAYIDHPTPCAMQHMRTIRCALDSAHATWMPLLASDITVGQFLRSPMRAARTLKFSRWRTPLQSLMLSIAKPATLHVRGWRRITLALLPQLRRRLFTLAFSLGNRWRYQFIIGRI